MSEEDLYEIPEWIEIMEKIIKKSRGKLAA